MINGKLWMNDNKLVLLECGQCPCGCNCLKKGIIFCQVTFTGITGPLSIFNGVFIAEYSWYPVYADMNICRYKYTDAASGYWFWVGLSWTRNNMNSQSIPWVRIISIVMGMEYAATANNSFMNYGTSDTHEQCVPAGDPYMYWDYRFGDVEYGGPGTYSIIPILPE